jgi:hypothetical protein
MTASTGKKSSGMNGENLIQHGAITLEFISHSDKCEVDPFTKKKVQELLTQMYVRAKKRGRPKLEEEKEAA